MSQEKQKPILMLSTIYPSHAGKSGYGRLAQYIAGAEFLSAIRWEPTGGAKLFFVRVVRFFAFSRWYLAGSGMLEWKARKRLKQGFDGVVHIMWADHDLGYLDLLLDKHRQKLCGTFHNCPDDFVNTIRFPSRLRNFDAVILMSETQRPFFLRSGVANEKIHVVLHGIDTEYFVPPKEPKDSDVFTLISVGGFRRNFPLLRKVCERLTDAPHIRFKIIAPKSWRTMFEGLPNVDFCSNLTDDELLAAYQAASCLLHTAENATANNALVEGMACGLPIIAERVGGIPEYVNAESSILADPGSDEALAAAIRKLAQSPELCASMSVAARKHAETLSWQQVAVRMQEIYQNL